MSTRPLQISRTHKRKHRQFQHLSCNGTNSHNQYHSNLRSIGGPKCPSFAKKRTHTYCNKLLNWQMESIGALVTIPMYFHISSKPGTWQTRPCATRWFSHCKANSSWAHTASATTKVKKWVMLALIVWVFIVSVRKPSVGCAIEFSSVNDNNTVTYLTSQLRIRHDMYSKLLIHHSINSTLINI